jgi:hypothetical protein
VRQSLEEDYTTVKNKNVTKIGLELVNIDLRVMIKIGADILSSTRGRSQYDHKSRIVMRTLGEQAQRKTNS